MVPPVALEKILGLPPFSFVEDRLAVVSPLGDPRGLQAVVLSLVVHGILRVKIVLKHIIV